jgi:hypothetical protein
MEPQRLPVMRAFPPAFEDRHYPHADLVNAELLEFFRS